MATLVINISGGNLHLDSLKLILPPAGRKEFECTEAELKVLCPELALYKARGRVRMIEDAEIVPPVPAVPSTPVIETHVIAPAPEPESAPAPEPVVDIMAEQMAAEALAQEQANEAARKAAAATEQDEFYKKLAELDADSAKSDA